MARVWKRAANLTLMYNEYPFLERYTQAAVDGFKGVECQFPYDTAPMLVKQALDDNHLTQVLINAPAGDWAQGERGIAALVGRESEFKTACEQAWQYAQVIDCSMIHVMAGVVRQAHTQMADTQAMYEQAFDTYFANLTWLADQFRDEPVSWVIEPINTRDFPDYLLNTQAQAHAIVQSLRSAKVGVQMDLYHCQIVEGDIESKLRQYLPTGHVRHLQIASVPRRAEPDVGELNYAHLFSVLDDLGYEGWVGCEYRPAEGTREGVRRWTVALHVD